MAINASAAEPKYRVEQFLPTGKAVAISGDTMVAGYGRYDEFGYAILFERQGRIWVESQRIQGREFAGAFGSAVALTDDLLIVSAPLASTGGDPGRGSGIVYSYEREGDSWIEKSASEGLLDWQYGGSLALSENIFAVGASGYNGEGELPTGTGLVCLGNRSDDPWEPICLRQPFLPEDPLSVRMGDYFDTAIAVSGNRLVITAPREDSSATG